MKAMRICVFVLFLCVLGFASISSAQSILPPILQTQPSASGFTFVQKSSNASAISSSPITLSLPSTGAGHLIVVQTYVRASSGGSFSVSDGVNTYTQVSAGVCQNGSNTEDTFYVLSGAGGNLTISVSYSGGVNSLYGNAREYSSTTPVSYISRFCTASPGSTTTPTGDTVNANGTNNLIVGGMIDWNAVSGGCNGSWTNCSANTNQSLGVMQGEDKLNQASGNYGAAFTLGSAQSDWMVETAAFKD
jgi:hypothetical protein